MAVNEMLRLGLPKDVRQPTKRQLRIRRLQFKYRRWRAYDSYLQMCYDLYRWLSIEGILQPGDIRQRPGRKIWLLTGRCHSGRRGRDLVSFSCQLCADLVGKVLYVRFLCDNNEVRQNFAAGLRASWGGDPYNYANGYVAASYRLSRLLLA